MIGFFKDWVLNIVTLVLFIVLIEMLVPSGRMKKYAGLVTGVVLIIAIITPFLKLIGSKTSLADIQISDTAFLDRTEIQKDSKLLEDEQMKQIIEVYRNKIIRQLEESARDTEGVADASADVIINEDYTSDGFGEIKRAYISIIPESETGGIKPVAKVDKVKIGQDNAAPAEDISVDPALAKKLGDRISNIYSVDKSNIVITRMKR